MRTRVIAGLRAWPPRRANTAPPSTAIAGPGRDVELVGQPQRRRRPRPPRARAVPTCSVATLGATSRTVAAGHDEHRGDEQRADGVERDDHRGRDREPAAARSAARDAHAERARAVGVEAVRPARRGAARRRAASARRGARARSATRSRPRRPISLPNSSRSTPAPDSKTSEARIAPSASAPTSSRPGRGVGRHAGACARAARRRPRSRARRPSAGELRRDARAAPATTRPGNAAVPDARA